MPSLAANRGVIVVSLEATFNLSDSVGSFLRQNGVTIFYRNPATGAINSYQPNRPINSLNQITQFQGYQIDNKSTSPIEFNDRWIGFGTIPNISHLNGTPIVASLFPVLYPFIF